MLPSNGRGRGADESACANAGEEGETRNAQDRLELQHGDTPVSLLIKQSADGISFHSLFHKLYASNIRTRCLNYVNDAFLAFG